MLLDEEVRKFIGRDRLRAYGASGAARYWRWCHLAHAGTSRHSPDAMDESISSRVA